jgi:predicted RNA-binding Zn ribbon-like protein
MMDSHTEWEQEHFIGGHPALDLSNAVFDRRAPTRDNELLKSARDIGSWLRASGLADDLQAEAVAGVVDPALVEHVREIREASFSIFDAIAAGNSPTAEALGFLFSRAANALTVEPVELNDTRPELTLAQWQDPDAVTAFLAVLSIEAFFTLPRERLRSCPRCGWLFVDTSRGGRRRWCSMRTCGNREKVSRHREHLDEPRHRSAIAKE